MSRENSSLPGVQDGLRRRSVHFHLCAHFLYSRSKRVNLLLLAGNRRTLRLCFLLLFDKGPMLFEELVAQHRVHGFIAHCVNLAFGITNHEIVVHFLDLFSHQAKLPTSIGINLLLVAEGDRFESENRLASLFHRLDFGLKVLRRGYHAELAAAVYKNCCLGDRSSTNTCNKCSRLE